MRRGGHQLRRDELQIKQNAADIFCSAIREIHEREHSIFQPLRFPSIFGKGMARRWIDPPVDEPWVITGNLGSWLPRFKPARSREKTREFKKWEQALGPNSMSPSGILWQTNYSKMVSSFSRKPCKWRSRVGCRIFRNALASIWRMRSRVTLYCRPISSSVRS